MLKYLCTISAILLFQTNCNAQSYEIVKANAGEYFLALADNNPESNEILNKLKSNLGVDTSYSSLADELVNYEKELKNISSDSALFLFNQWYLKLSNKFYSYSNDKFFSSGKVKVMLFSTSVSCYCTMNMCKNQTAEILKFAKENNIDYWIIDAYEYNELQIKYGTLFSPSVILFGPENNILTTIEYDEKMIENLKKFYSQREKI